MKELLLKCDHVPARETYAFLYALSPLLIPLLSTSFLTYSSLSAGPTGLSCSCYVSVQIPRQTEELMLLGFSILQSFTLVSRGKAMFFSVHFYKGYCTDPLPSVFCVFCVSLSLCVCLFLYTYTSEDQSFVLVKN